MGCAVTSTIFCPLGVAVGRWEGAREKSRGKKPRGDTIESHGALERDSYDIEVQAPGNARTECTIPLRSNVVTLAFTLKASARAIAPSGPNPLSAMGEEQEADDASTNTTAPKSFECSPS